MNIIYKKNIKKYNGVCKSVNIWIGRRRNRERIKVRERKFSPISIFQNGFCNCYSFHSLFFFPNPFFNFPNLNKNSILLFSTFSFSILQPLFPIHFLTTLPSITHSQIHWIFRRSGWVRLWSFSNSARLWFHSNCWISPVGKGSFRSCNGELWVDFFNAGVWIRWPICLNCLKFHALGIILNLDYPKKFEGDPNEFSYVYCYIYFMF